LIQLLQADEALYKALVKKYGENHLEDKLIKTLQNIHADNMFAVNAELFYTLYRVM